MSSGLPASGGAPADNRLTEQTWFAATTAATNVGILASVANIPLDLHAAFKWGSFSVSFIAFFLVVQRGGYIDVPGRAAPASSTNAFLRKVIETAWNIAWFIPRTVFIILECSGSLLYALFIVLSWLAVYFVL